MRLPKPLTTLGLAGAAAIALAAGGSEAAPRYRQIPGEPSIAYGFWDETSVRPDGGGDVRLSLVLLMVGPNENGPPGSMDTVGRIRDMSVACDWGLVAPSEDALVMVMEDGREEPQSGGNINDWQTNPFPDGFNLTLFELVCGGARAEGPTFDSYRAVADHSIRSTTPPEPGVGAPRLLLPTPPTRLGKVAFEQAGLNAARRRALYADWASLNRQGDLATLGVLTVVGLPNGKAGFSAYRPVTLDCRARTMTIGGYTRRDLRHGWDSHTPAIKPLPVAALDNSRRLLDRACGGEIAKGTLTSVEAATADAEAAWGR